MEREVKMNVITHISYEVFDPLDDRPLLATHLAYEIRKSCRGYYTRYRDHMAKCAKHVWGDVLEGREPLVTTTIHRRKL